MARLINLEQFNTNRKDLVKIKKLDEETILFTKDEAKEALLEYITQDLKFFSDGLPKYLIDELNHHVVLKLSKFEKEIDSFISTRINEIAEKMVEKTLTRVMEEKINEKVNEKLDKLKSML